MLRNHLWNGAQQLLASAEANVNAALSETEITLLNSYNIIHEMLERNAGKEEILDYLTTTSRWLRERDSGLLDFYGIYGYFYGEFYDGMEINPGDDYVPQTRPWYQTAVRSGANVAYTVPYPDWNTGTTVVTAVRNVFLDNDMVGILAVDIGITWLVEYVGSLSLSSDGFGMLLSQNLTFMAYPDEGLIGRQFQALGNSYDVLASILRSGEDIFGHRIIDPDRGPVIVFIQRIFNDWYVGLLTPSSQFYRDLQTSAQILIALGLVLSLSLCFILIRLSMAKQRSDEESRAKSSFLAHMSHEIRTPLNAVIGLSEIVLNRGKLLNDSRNDVQQIHQSGSSLLGIINDILDISKIEAEGFELIPAEYDTASLINDTIMLNRVRIGSKPIIFNIEIEEDFPCLLLGDELRVKQILNNILSNAIKYTKEGSVRLSITWEKTGQIHFSVSDTGIGIRPEDMNKLFTEYAQLHAGSTRMVEGTGLGLAITKKLVEMMGGRINAESEYGKGTVFTVTIVQGIINSAGIGKETVENLKFFKFESRVREKEVDYSKISNGRVLVVDDLPVNLQVAKGLLEPYNLIIETADSGQQAIDMIQAGSKYDLVFMDHMMPEMDGIEAVRLIRVWESTNNKEQVPIVALTANALAGNMEMFLSKGFNGFLPKPIDILRLDETLNQWLKELPESGGVQNVYGDEKEIEEVSGDLTIDKVDVQKGISMTGGTVGAYISVLSIFHKDADERLPLLQNPPDIAEIINFVTQVHALKSASYSIGATGISEMAAELEKAGKDEDMDIIKMKLPIFHKALSELSINIKNAIENYKEKSPSPSGGSASAQVSSLLKNLAIALEEQKANEISRILREINDFTGDMDIAYRDALERISDEVMMVEYDNAKEILTNLMAGNHGS
ncbi:MAG: ATP-binding protein [Treponema sp.]|nr:ATP-binding protein [Treponema sp.]